MGASESALNMAFRLVGEAGPSLVKLFLALGQDKKAFIAAIDSLYAAEMAKTDALLKAKHGR